MIVSLTSAMPEFAKRDSKKRPKGTKIASGAARAEWTASEEVPGIAAFAVGHGRTRRDAIQACRRDRAAWLEKLRQHQRGLLTLR